jgi:anti-anti-sigma factor
MSDAELHVNDVKAAHFSTSSALRGGVIVVSVSGNADMVVLEPLKAFLEAVDSEAKRLATSEVVFELADLFFMNSSCLSVLMRMVNGVSTAEAGRRYKLRFRVNPNLRWQKRSLRALSAVAQDVVLID